MPAAAARRAAAGSAARAAALAVLQSVLRRRRPLDEALAAGALEPLDSRDRALVRQLVATALRRLGTIDAVIDACLAKPVPARATGVRDLLRLGACQLLFLRVPAHAAIDTTVALVAARGGEAGFKGLVNAILRRIDRERDALLLLHAAPAANTPPWLWQSWEAAYGPSAAAIAKAHLADPPLDLSLSPAAGPPSDWAARLDAVALPTGSLRRRLAAEETRVERLPGYDEGAWWVQDAAAALPARLLGPVAGRPVIDLCAAPGGKTAQLAAAGGQVIAVERSPARLKRLGENLARLRLTASLVEADATQWRPPAPADAVLLDAPCSATGTIRRHPDIPWLKSPDDLPKLAALQDRLLDGAVAMTGPGGTVVYAVCSLQPEEGPQRIAALLARGAPAERAPIASSELPGMAELLTADGDLRTLPCHWADKGGMDGFYACRLRRL
jgi:16S rRNA (cytosine967-C5)-methyltransferase